MKVSGVSGRKKRTRHVGILISVMNYQYMQKTVRKTSFWRVWQGFLIAQSSEAKGMFLLVLYVAGRHLRRLPLCDVQSLIQYPVPYRVSPALWQKKTTPLLPVHMSAHQTTDHVIYQ